MLTRLDYTNIISDIKIGSSFRVALSSHKEFNSQRMILYRVIQTISKWKNLNISIRKIEEGGKIFLEFERKENNSFQILERNENGEFLEKTITSDVSKEDLEFGKWVTDLEQAKISK